MSDKCERCGKNDADEPHYCPYEEDVGNCHDDNSCSECTCCTECRHECLMDI